MRGLSGRASRPSPQFYLRRWKPEWPRRCARERRLQAGWHPEGEWLRYGEQSIRGAAGSHKEGSYLLTEIFGGSGVHARTAIGVPFLPDGTPVELVVSLGA